MHDCFFQNVRDFSKLFVLKGRSFVQFYSELSPSRMMLSYYAIQHHYNTGNVKVPLVKRSRSVMANVTYVDTLNIEIIHILSDAVAITIWVAWIPELF